MLCARKRSSFLTICVLFFSACSQPDEVAQTRYQYLNTVGKPTAVSYEVASHWIVGGGDNYNLPIERRHDARLGIDVRATRHMRETLEEKLKRVTQRGRSDKDRGVLVTKMTTVNGLKALEYAESGEAYKPPEERYFSHSVEFIMGEHVVDVEIAGHSKHYPVLLKQLRHTLSSMQPLEKE